MLLKRRDQGTKLVLEKEREALIADIKRYFADVEYPKKMPAIPELVDFRGMQWHELSVKEVLSNHDLFFFPADVFKYFLPGYLVVMLQNPERMTDGFIIEAMLKQLSQRWTHTPRQDLCALFDKKQRQVILKFLDLFLPVWLSYDDMENELARVDPKRRDRARKDIIKKRNALLDLLESAKQYWEECK